jgi:molybdate/tungstate transport system substrate-binding protein
MEQLRARCADEHVVPDESELVKLLESRSIDYAFIYRSTAESHHHKLTLLPPQTSLSRPEFADHYRKASVEIHVTREKKARVYGKPIVYSLTIPTNARNSRDARAFVAFLLGEKQRAAFTRAGFRALQPAPCRRCDTLPAELRRFTDTAR